MDAQQIANAAALLVKARRGGPLLADLPASSRPASVTDAHAIQDAVTAALGEQVGAFKAMAPANAEATRGVIYAGTIHPSPARIPAAEVPQCGVEGEVAFIFRRDLPARAVPILTRGDRRRGACLRRDRSRHQPLPEFRCGLQFGETGRLHQQWRLRACRSAGRLAKPGTRQAEGDAYGERRAGARSGGRAPDRRSAWRGRGAGEHDA